MPWTAADAGKHHKGLTAKQKRQWAHVANSQLQTCLDKGGSKETCEGQAIRAANSVVNKASEVEENELYTLVLKQDAPLRYTLGVVYAPMEEDLQGDFAKAETIRSAAWGFMRSLQNHKTLTKWSYTLLDGIVKALKSSTPIRLDVTNMVEEITKARGLLGDQHCDWDDGLGDVVECYCMPCEGEIAGEIVKQGTWMLGVIWSPAYFAKIQAGERTGYSMGGRGRRKFVEDMAYA